eukprot:3940234-Rhodomonas_salina.1
MWTLQTVSVPQLLNRCQYYSNCAMSRSVLLITPCLRCQHCSFYAMSAPCAASVLQSLHSTCTMAGTEIDLAA